MAESRFRQRVQLSGLPFLVATVAGLVAADRAEARGVSRANRVLAFLAAAAVVYLAIGFAQRITVRWTAARKRSRPTV